MEGPPLIVDDPLTDDPISSSDSNSSDSSNNDDDATMLVLMALHLFLTTHNSFQSIELSRENQISVNPKLSMNDLLARLSHSPSQFRDMTNFTIEEFMELYTYVVPTIENNARSTSRRHIVSGHPSKLTGE